MDNFHHFLFFFSGYQVRYFTVDAQKGLLSYYLCEGPEENPQPVLTSLPRGQVSLAAAVICPSEDSRTFNVNCASGEILKLRAADAKSRQEWVDGLRAIVESHGQAFASVKAPLSVRDSLAAFDALDACRQQLQQTETCNANMIRAIESASAPTDPDYLMLKALSATTTTVLFQCLGLLQKYQEFQGDGEFYVV